MVQEQHEREQQIGEQARGRRRWNERTARQVLEAWEASGESLREFARRMKLGQQRLSWWSKRLGGRQAGVLSQAGPELPGFVPVVVRPKRAVEALEQAAAVLRVEGARIELRELTSASAAWAATLLETLQRRA